MTYEMLKRELTKSFKQEITRETLALGMSWSLALELLPYFQPPIAPKGDFPIEEETTLSAVISKTFKDHLLSPS